VGSTIRLAVAKEKIKRFSLEAKTAVEVNE
jgi:hypothetical protein